MRRPLLLLAILLLVALPMAADCEMPAADRAFLEESWRTWEVVREEALKLGPAPWPMFIVFNETCVWRDGKGSEHGGKIALPDGNEIPPAITTFASTHEGKPFVVIALPVVWRTEQRMRDNPRLELLIRSVFVHEMTHTRQAGSLGARLTELEKTHDIKDLNDDLIQQRFADRDGFTAAFQKERDLLYAIADEPNARKRRALAKKAVAAIRERRAKYFRGDEAQFAEIEEIFIGMEGVANWAGFKAAMHAGLSRADAITLMQGSRRWFSQDEGLALFLAIDALAPGWQKRVFQDEPAAAFDLLAPR